MATSMPRPCARPTANSGTTKSTDRATAYLEALCTETGIPVSSLCLSLKGGSHQGTWIHPQVAVDLARWISAPFAVWMDGWFLDELTVKHLLLQATNHQVLIHKY